MSMMVLRMKVDIVDALFMSLPISELVRSVGEFFPVCQEQSVQPGFKSLQRQRGECCAKSPFRFSVRCGKAKTEQKPVAGLESKKLVKGRYPAIDLAKRLGALP